MPLAQDLNPLINVTYMNPEQMYLTESKVAILSMLTPHTLHCSEYFEYHKANYRQLIKVLKPHIVSQAQWLWQDKHLMQPKRYRFSILLNTKWTANGEPNKAGLKYEISPFNLSIQI